VNIYGGLGSGSGGVWHSAASTAGVWPGSNLSTVYWLPFQPWPAVASTMNALLYDQCPGVQPGYLPRWDVIGDILASGEWNVGWARGVGCVWPTGSLMPVIDANLVPGLAATFLSRYSAAAGLLIA
jgi:hypothetical protein